MTTLWLGLGLAMVSALAVNWAYSREHDAVASMPPFTWRRPVAFVSALLRSRPWVVAFGTETVGWLLYVAALRLAPLSLVQAVGASGIAVLAFATARGHPSRLTRREQLAVVIAVAGLVLLAVSVVDVHQVDHAPAWTSAALWLGASGAAALILIAAPLRLARGPALGLAAGLLFAGGDICAKLVVYGGAWLAAILPLIVCYALGTSVLQGAFQHANALTTAGLATLATNAVPIAAGFVVFGEQLPDGVRGGLQVAAFSSLVVSGTLLGRSRPPEPAAA
jgi:drug/metabolite transporter (DMT)-like permease